MTRKINLALLEKMLRDGESRGEMAYRFDVSERAVDKAITRHFPELRKTFKRIDNEAAVEMFARGMKRADIARHFGVGWEAVQNVLKRMERRSGESA